MFRLGHGAFKAVGYFFFSEVKISNMVFARRLIDASVIILFGNMAWSIGLTIRGVAYGAEVQICFLDIVCR